MVFINKMDTASTGVRPMLEALQDASERPLVLREIPLRENPDGAGAITGHVDLVSERAFAGEDHKTSNLVEVPDALAAREEEERTGLLEALADFDDGLLEELLEDVAPSTDEIYENLKRDLKQDLIVPVFFGSAEHDNGIRRLFKALRHETPEPTDTAERLCRGVVEGKAAARVFKISHAGQAGKLALARVLKGEIKDGMALGAERVSGLFSVHGAKTDKLKRAGLGQVCALGRMDGVQVGDLLTPAEKTRLNWPDPLGPLYALSVHAPAREDEVKLTGALAKLAEEDPSLSVEQNEDTGELLLRGQGDVHLKVALERLKNHFGLEVEVSPPRVPYKETIRKGTSQHARHKKQSGGHGEFGDVHLDVKPLPRGSGFTFEETIAGGAVPRQYIPAVEAGVREYLAKGPLGYPVVDIAVTLTDGQAHSVDSSEMAFKKAAQQAMRDALPACAPVLLEPICHVEVSAPNTFTSNLQRLISGRRGQIMAFNPTEGRRGWDTVTAQMPQAEMQDLVIELRSATQGTGLYAARFDHLAEVTGKAAEAVLSA
jgi:elongation factor G